MDAVQHNTSARRSAGNIEPVAASALLCDQCIAVLHQLPRKYLLKLVSELLRRSTQQPGEYSIEDHLSARELQVLVLVANGYSRQNMAEALGISPNTAARHIANVYAKLDICSVAEATACAISYGLVSLGQGGRPDARNAGSRRKLVNL